MLRTVDLIPYFAMEKLERVRTASSLSVEFRSLEHIRPCLETVFKNPRNEIIVESLCPNVNNEIALEVARVASSHASLESVEMWMSVNGTHAAKIVEEFMRHARLKRLVLWNVSIFTKKQMQALMNAVRNFTRLHPTRHLRMDPKGWHDGSERAPFISSEWKDPAVSMMTFLVDARVRKIPDGPLKIIWEMMGVVDLFPPHKPLNLLERFCIIGEFPLNEGTPRVINRI